MTHKSWWRGYDEYTQLRHANGVLYFDKAKFKEILTLFKTLFRLRYNFYRSTFFTVDIAQLKSK